MPRVAFRVCLIVISITSVACGSSSSRQEPKASADAAFQQVSREYLDAYYKRHPTAATYLGVHTYDDQLDGYSREAVMGDIAANREFKQRVSSIDTNALSVNSQ